MKKLLSKVIFFSAFLLSVLNLKASHVAGGDVEYRCIGPRTWKIKLTIYRECTGAALCSNISCTQPMIAKPNTLLNPTGCSATPSQVNLTLSLISVQDIGIANIGYCGSSAKNGCNNLGQVTPGPNTPSIEKYVFEGTLNLNLPSLNTTNCTYWDVYWELCCRNSGIWNLAGSSGQSFRIGATINIFNRSQNPCQNNSPVLKNEPIVKVCSGQEFNYNMDAVDIDGDSISYEISPSIQQGGNPVIYQSPGSAIYPFPLNSNLPPHSNFPQPNGPYVIIDSMNGNISFNAQNNTSNYIFGNLNVLLKQWAYNSNGIPLLVGITQRDLLFYSYNCTANNPPRFVTSPTLPNNQPKLNYIVNAGQQLCFTITAKDTDFYPSIPRFDSTFITWSQSISRPGKLSITPNYIVGPNQPKPREDSWQFCWQTEASDIRSMPYNFIIRARDNVCPNTAITINAIGITVIPAIQLPNHILNKTHLNCGNLRYQIQKGTPFVSLDSASLRIANAPNDKNFLMGFRNINPININPQGSLQDSTPRLMFTDSFRYTQPGKYYVLFTYKATQGNITNVLDSFIISNDSIALASIFTQYNTSFCNGDSSLIMSSYTNPKYKYQWQKNGVNIIGAKTESIYAKQSGLYRLLVTDTIISCNNFSNSISINVNPRVSIKPSLITNQYCAFKPNGISYFDSSSIATGTFTRVWHFGDGTTSTNLSGNKIYNNNGTFAVKLVVTSSSGCKDSTITNVSIIQPAKPSITANGNTSFCNGSSLILVGPTHTNANYYWYKNNMLVSGNSVTKTIVDQGNYKLVVDLGNNCKDTTNIISTTLYPSPKVGFTVNNSSQCENNNLFVLIDTTKITSGTFNRTWSWDNNTSNLANLNTSFSTAGVKSIKLKAVSNNGCSDSVTKNVTVLSKPNIGTIAGSTNGVNTQQTYDYNLNQQLNHSYNWSLTNGNIISGQGTNAIRVQWLTPGTGKINAVIANNVGCSDSASLNVNIVGVSQAPIITSFTPQNGTNGTLITINGSNLNGASAVLFGGVNAKNFNVASASVITATVDTGATGNVSVVTPNGTALLSGFTYNGSTGIAEFLTQSYSIFPNPVSSEMIIESDKTLNNSSFELMDLNGKVLMSTTCNTPTNRLTLDLKTLSPAVYLLRITSQGQSSTVKVVKQ